MNKKLGRLLNPGVWAYFICMLGFVVVSALLDHYLLAIIELLLTGLFFLGHLVYRTHRRRELEAFVQRLTDEITGTKGAKSPFPSAVVRLSDGVVVHTSNRFAEITGFRDTMIQRRIEDVLPDFSLDWLISGKNEAPNEIAVGKRRYRVHGTSIRADDPQSTALGVLYLADLTELYQIKDEYIRSRPVVSIILVDNYDELTRNLSEGAISAMNAGINNAITEWAEGYHGLLRRLEKNRFLLVFEKRDLKEAMDKKFTILEEIHKITNPSGLTASISFGLGVDGTTFEESYKFASLSIEMALSRGGDQAVVKDRVNFHFFGGRAKEAEHRSKVRSRVVANSLMELIGQSSSVFIMGHKMADLDAFGAAVGVACLCRKKNKPFYIVLDVNNNAAGKLIREVCRHPEYRGTIVSGQDALLHCDNRSTLVVVDTNRPDQLEFRPLLESISRVCVIDHHRRAADYIDPVVVNLHEPYASSAAELVTELLEYAVEKSDVLDIEAKSLLAGIFLDTKSFHVRTGERTFEAAAYLRQLGADTVEVKKLLQNNMEDAKEKFEIIQCARTYRNEIAIAVWERKTSRVLAAQAADELLNISGITASFVLYQDSNKVFISARSIGQTNVQMILEPLGGGGNTATAGAQIKDRTIREVLVDLKESIDQYFAE